MSPQSPAKRKFQIPKWLVPALGFAVSIVSLYFAFRKFDYAQLGQDLQHLVWPWIIAGVALELLSYVVDAWRWNVILSPAEQPSLLQSVQATFIGLFANDVLPAKAGEVIRPYLLSRWAGIPLSLTITSAVMERLLDGIVIVSSFFLVSYGMRGLPGWLYDLMGTLTISVAIITAVFLFVLFYRSHADRLVKSRSWAIKFTHFLDELHLLGCWRTLGVAFAMSYGYFLCQFLAVFCLARAYSFDFGLRESAFVLLVVRLVTLIPNAPGNVGSFQLFCEKALSMLMVESFNAKSFAVIAYFFITAPPLVVGALCVMLTGLSLGEIHKQAHHAHREHAEKREIAPDKLPAA